MGRDLCWRSMMFSPRISCLLAFALSHSGESLLLTATSSTNSSVASSGHVFMLVAGISAPTEMCLTALAGRVSLEACAEAVAAGDGREIWSFQAGGQLLHVASGACAAAADAAVGSAVAMVACDGAGTWELLGNGQARLGSLCLSQRGAAAGFDNVAAKVSAFATSTVDAAAHGASAVTDLSEASFWASGASAGPVSLTLDLGAERSLDSLKIYWEFPAKSFTVSVSVDGERWIEKYATTTNVLRRTKLAMGGTLASRVKITMQEAHPTLSVFQGRALYGVASISVLASRLDATLADCASAAATSDARDKYFVVSASDFDPSAASALRKVVPSLESGVASLSASLSEVAAAIPQVPACAASGGLGVTNSTLAGPVPPLTAASRTNRRRMGVSTGASAPGSAAELDVAAAIDLLGVAKSAILELRTALL